ncbi:hypothetical protein G7Z99_11540 [Pseudomonas entomophila]|uniref:hypothetical protein n=1 Tax=Pseudomonas entomophila TaxID=312306 RepID=UPI0015E28084|nr:hypothetical protein [Pseudomonas entomophila]MBA1189679.1 hypothetical protein [Pseudomonas entomophila]
MTLSLTGTLTTPVLPHLEEGAPRLSVSLIGHLADAQQVLATCSSQCTGVPMPFTLTLDTTAAQRFMAFTVEALCTVGLGEDAIIAQHRETLEFDQLPPAQPLNLVLKATGMAPTEGTPHPGTFTLLGGQVSIPAELRQPHAYLDCALLVIQEDGYSNRYASNIAEHSLYLEGDTAPFTLSVDTAALPPNSRCKLHIGLYSLDRTRLHAGNVIRHIDLNALPDLSAVSLRKPRR